MRGAEVALQHFGRTAGSPASDSGGTWDVSRGRAGQHGQLPARCPRCPGAQWGFSLEKVAVVREGEQVPAGESEAAVWESALWGLLYMCANKSFANKTDFSNPMPYEPGCL